MKPALLIGQNPDSMRPFPILFKRVGLELTVFSLTKAFHKKHPICTVAYFEDEVQLCEALSILDLNNYSFIFLADDETIAAIINSNLSQVIKQKLLPVVSARYWPHLNSKIGLNKFLQDSDLRYPPSFIAHNEIDLEEGAKFLGFPLLVKQDASSGGRGIYECTSFAQLSKLTCHLCHFPLLLQRKIAGECLDLSGFFQNGELISFTYSQFETTAYSQFGPSILRTYYQTALVDPLIIDELRNLGRTLGLHGFANISCIQASADQQRYYFEADARPNAWIDFGKYIGEDIALVFARFPESGKLASMQSQINSQLQNHTLIPNFLRLSLWEIAINRYDCWRYIEQIRFSEVILYNILRRSLGRIESLRFLKRMFRGRPALELKLEKLYLQLKRKAVGLF